VLKLSAGATVNLAVEDDTLLVYPHPKPRYTLDELIAQCDLSAPISETELDREWLDLAPLGREL
jgi:antitoxin ChpS